MRTATGVMGGPESGRQCARGERCAQHEGLGQPGTLSRYSKDDICVACRERERDAQVGVTGDRGPDLEAGSRGRSVPSANEQEAAAHEGIGEPPKPGEAAEGQTVMSVKVYDRDGWSPEEWRRLCERHGEAPDSEVIHVWENAVPVETRRDNTTVCGRPGVAVSGYALACAECWGLIRSGKPPRVCEPWDYDPTLPEERYESLLRAARTLLRAGVTKEEEIIPTLVWAAKSWELGLLKTTTDRFVGAGEGAEEWVELKGRFAGALGAFEPIRVVDGVLVLRWVPIAVTGVVDQETGTTETILIDVRRRSVKPEDVAQRYTAYLQRRGIRHDASQGFVGFAVSNGILRLSVRPEEPWAHPTGRPPARPRNEQLPFPEARFVEGMYGALKGSKDEGFGGTLFGREKGPPGKPNNVVLATCAWYLGRRGELIEQPPLRPEVARLLNRGLLGPCSLDPLVEGAWTPADTVWRSSEKLTPWVLGAEHEVREAYLALSLSL